MGAPLWGPTCEIARLISEHKINNENKITFYVDFAILASDSMDAGNCAVHHKRRNDDDNVY